MMDNLRPLTQEQRQAARQAARQAVVRSIGPHPAREQYTDHTTCKYPPIVTRVRVTYYYDWDGRDQCEEQTLEICHYTIRLTAPACRQNTSST